MGFVTLNNFDVEKASQKLVYENLFPAIQHINGKGCTDKYTMTDDVRSVTYIDIMRILPYAPRFRQLGATNNGAWHNKLNEGGYNNSPESEHFTVAVDLIYDEGVQISSPQIYSNPVALRENVMRQIIETAGMSINIVTFAKQLEGFFRNGDNFDKAKTHEVGAIIASDIKAEEIANAVFAYDPTAVGIAPNSPTNALLKANASLSNGVEEIGAYVIPADERQGFITPMLDVLIKAQYQQNASEASARILATGFINPFTATEDKRIDTRTGLCGTYDGVDLFMVNNVTRKFVYVALGLLGTVNDAEANRVAVRGYLDKINGIIVYGAGTCRGIVGPNVLANPNAFYGGVYILPQMKMGVEVLHGATIKLIIDGGAGAVVWTAEEIAKIMNTVKFTAIDGSVVKGNIKGFNSGKSN